ncbi:MAG: ABC transporter ATP-binding protein [bacterium]|nr:ABC transporter ATP-binding protein [bacterium]
MSGTEKECVVNADDLSKWYGNIQGVSEITARITPGIQGLLGPNGAGKSTFLKIVSGQLKQSRGNIAIFGEPVYNNHELFSRIGFCPEYDCHYKEATGWEFMMFLSKMHSFKGKEAKEKAAYALERVGMEEHAKKRIGAFSMGMRQRLKIAGSIVHEPELLILDEPLRGIDPLWRVKIIKLIKEFEKQGKTVIVSSHILPEIESMTSSITLIHQGKIFAHGNIQQIRDLLDSHPHKISLQCQNPRLVAEKLVHREYVLNIDFDDEESKIVVMTNNRDKFFDSVMGVIVENELEVAEITSPDDNLQAVFDYLIGR